MKKMIAMVLALLMIVSLAGCARQQATSVGGWTPAEGAKISEEAQAAFDKAMEALVGVNYTPVALLATQLVSGMNYCLLCEAAVVYPDAQPYYALVYIYRDLQGNAEIKKIVRLDMGDIAESGEVREAESAGEALMGGWAVDRESSVELDGALLHLGSQIVAGVNHCVLCEGNELVFVYEDPEGKTEVTQRVALDVAALSE